MTVSTRNHPHASTVPLLPPRRDPARLWALAVMALVPPLCGVLALLLGADASWDLRNYHWYNAFAFLNGRRDMDFMPSQAQFFLNPLLDLPFYFLATHLQPVVAFFILGTIQGLNFPLLFMIAYATLALDDTQKRAVAAAGLAAAGLFSAIGISEIGTVFYDNVTSLGVLASVLLLLRKLVALQEMPEKRAAAYVALAGLPAGLMAGLKLTCVSYSFGMCLALLVFTPVARRCLLLSFCFGLGVTAGYLAAYGYWGWHLFALTGNPVFPFFNIVFHSPLLPRDSLLLDFAPPHNWRILVFPFLFSLDPKLVNEVSFQDWRIPALYGLMIWLFLQYRLTKRRARGGAITAVGPTRFLLLAGGISFYVWLMTETVYRYLLPLDMLAPLLIAACVGLLPLARYPRIVTAIAVVAALSLTVAPGNWGRHAAWPDAMVDAVVPAIPDPPHTMILMTGYDAYAYLLPAFPPQAQFVRLESRGIEPDTSYGLTSMLRQKVGAHRGPLMLLVPEHDLATSAPVLKAFHLAVRPGTCLTVLDRLSEAPLDRPQDEGNAYPRRYSLCDVAREKR